MSRCPSPYFNSTKVQFRGRRGACWQWSPRISIPLRYNLEGQKCSRCTTRCVISIPLRYNLEGMASQAQQSYHDISIPLRYNLEGEDENIPYQFQTHFNSTKVQFRDPFAIRYNKANSISIPLRYNLEGSAVSLDMDGNYFNSTKVQFRVHFFILYRLEILLFQFH